MPNSIARAIEHYRNAFSPWWSVEGACERDRFRSFFLIHLLVLCGLFYGALFVLGVITGGQPDRLKPFAAFAAFFVPFYAYVIYSSGPFVSIIIRRLHDTGRSARWMVLLLIPAVGWLLFLILMIGTKGPDRTGETTR